MFQAVANAINNNHDFKPHVDVNLCDQYYCFQKSFDEDDSEGEMQSGIGVAATKEQELP